MAIGNRFHPAVLLGLALAGALPAGCGHPRTLVESTPAPAGGRAFDFHRDTFDFANELVWEYRFDPESGRMRTQRRTPPPEYALRCFVLARSTQQFFDHARFVPGAPASEEFYRRQIREVVARNPRRRGGSAPVPVPGYADLREFSAAQETLLKEELGGAWQSYLQRGHWRMVFPFGRGGQARLAEELLAVRGGEGPAVVHLVRFPALTINHALVVYAAEEADSFIRFLAYDPNEPRAPAELFFDRANRSFLFPANAYFAGGEVDLYRVYHAACY